MVQQSSSENNKTSHTTHSVSIRKCSRCKVKLNSKYKLSTCEKCRAYKSALDKKKREEAKKCKKEGCSSKAHKDCGFKYCKLHIRLWKEEQTGGDTVRRCKGRYACDPENPGVKKILPDDYLKASCENCLEKARINANKKNSNITYHNNKLGKKIGYKCPKCPLEIIIDKKDMGVRENGEISNYCKKHFDQRQKIQRNRDRSDYDYKEYESRPEVKEKRKKFRKENPHLTYKYAALSRAKKRDTDPEKFRKEKAEYAKLWREKNPDKVKETNAKKKISLKQLYRIHLDRSIKAGYKSELTREQHDELVSNDCFYCGQEITSINYNGIDRKNNKIGYVLNNCVTSCKICNMMKNTLNMETFILMCINIVNYSFDTDLRYDIDVSHNVSASSYAYYKSRADKKGCAFELTTDDVTFLNSKQCYLCGKLPSNKHKNGIDRIDNNIGYILSNCESCCSDCNYMKGEYDLDTFLEHCYKITYRFYDQYDKIKKKWKPSNFIEKNITKMSDEERKELTQIRINERNKKTSENNTLEAIEQRAGSKKKK